MITEFRHDGARIVPSDATQGTGRAPRAGSPATPAAAGTVNAPAVRTSNPGPCGKVPSKHRPPGNDVLSLRQHVLPTMRFPEFIIRHGDTMRGSLT